ncbi:S-adenosyl-L-methionine-dependent methyltransferase [Phyllosticta citribraziliensis]|uniref:S-adenosyl-L-methionine-dependent methyltransferase n=1 Tax=Phyllosticta citribraziliensis TaxID=989973 RepID=A0ABR1L7M2_9PEZI
MTCLSLNATFDASLVDLSAHQTQDSESFSTTETEIYDMSAMHDRPSDPSTAPKTSSSSVPAAQKSVWKEPHMPVRYMDTTSAYDAWASVYDTDGNVLQAIDDMEMEKLLPQFLDLICPSALGEQAVNEPLRVTDLGCGTGRNTMKLLDFPWDQHLPEATQVDVRGVDASAKMLDEARKKLGTATKSATRVELRLVQHDILHPNDPSSSPHALPGPAHGVISTLVVEHVPLPDFFQSLSRLLRPDGYALVTNMHPAMGAKAQAGFVSTDEEGRKIKVRGKSWVHGIEETVYAAQREGLAVVGNVLERAVDEEMLRDGRISERGRKWIGSEVWFGVVLQKRK